MPSYHGTYSGPTRKVSTLPNGQQLYTTREGMIYRIRPTPPPKPYGNGMAKANHGKKESLS